jgi:hypothetical protein
MSKIEVNTVDVQCGSTLTLGSSGKTVTLASGASQSGFGRTGTVDWCTTAKTSPFTAVNGKGYFVDTSSSEITVTLPASPSAGDILAIADLKGTFDTNRVVLCRNSSKIKGACGNLQLQDERMATSIIYSGSCQGWISINNTNVTCGATIKPLTYGVQYLVVAGGGGGGYGIDNGGGGGGAGGYRTVSCKSFNVLPATSFPITIGAGGATTCSNPGRGGAGSNSVFSTITSAGGGGAGGAGPGGPPYNGDNGGSGGGGAGEGSGSGGTGNTPPVSPPQGNNGGDGNNATGSDRGGGGGGAGAAGTTGTEPGKGCGGIGSNTTIMGSIPQAPTYGESGPNPGRYFAGGGGSGNVPGPAPSGGTGGGGRGAGGSPVVIGLAGTANTGGGGGGGGQPTYTNAKSGGSGIVIIRHATADASPSVSGGDVVATCGSDTIRVFTSSGTFTS